MTLSLLISKTPYSHFLLTVRILTFLLATDWMAVGFRLLRKLPIVKGMVDQELDKAVNEMEEEITK